MIDKDKTLVAKNSNQLIRAQYSLSRKEKRVMSLCAHKLMIKSYIRDPKHGIAHVTIRTSEYANIHKISLSNASENLRTSLASIAKKGVTFADPKTDTVDHKGASWLGWIIGTADKPKNGEFVMAVNPLLEDHLYKLEGGEFTLVDLMVQGMLNGNVARLYDSFCNHHRMGENLGVIEMYIPWMIERYELPKSYERMPDFRRRFLHNAVREMTEHTPFKMIDDEGNMTIEEVIPKGASAPNKVIFRYKYESNSLARLTESI